jgi:hypothetical protein
MKHDVGFLFGRPVQGLAFEAGFERPDRIVDEVLGSFIIVNHPDNEIR